MHIGPPWTPDRYEEIDHCIARNFWKNTITNIQTEPNTNVNTDHYTMVATIRQRPKANDKTEPEINFKNIDIVPDTDEKGSPNPLIVKFNEKVQDLFANDETSKDVGNFADAIKKAAIETPNIKPSRGKRQDCDPEMATLIEQRLQALSQHKEDETKLITKAINKLAAQKRTKAQLDEFYAGNWTSVKRARMGFVPGHTKLRNQRGEIVNDRLRADTFAKYYEEVHWAPDNTQNDTDLETKQEPIHSTCNDIDTDEITIGVLDMAIKQLKRNKAPGPDGTTAELYKWLDPDNRATLLDTINDCWNNETLHKTMNEANLAIIHKKGNPELPQNYRPIALLNIAYTLLAIIILKRIVPHMDGRIDKSQYGFRKSRSIAQPLFILRRAQEMQEEAGLETHILFLDWEKAFDKVNQTKLLTALTRIGISTKMLP